MTKLETMIDQAGKIVILGHVNPDGDCVGSCLAVYNYIKEWDSSKAVTVRLERVPSKFSYLSGFDAIETEAGEETYDLCICLDSSDEERLGDFKSCFDRSAENDLHRSSYHEPRLRPGKCDRWPCKLCL